MEWIVIRTAMDSMPGRDNPGKRGKGLDSGWDHRCVSSTALVCAWNESLSATTGLCLTLYDLPQNGTNRCLTILDHLCPQLSFSAPWKKSLFDFTWHSIIYSATFSFYCRDESVLSHPRRTAILLPSGFWPIREKVLD